MTIVEFKNVSKSFFSQNLYKHVDLEVNSGDKIALVGNNGTGKSTLIKLLSGAENPDRGTVIREEEAVISCFDQFGRVDLDSKVQDLLNSPFEKVMTVQAELDAVSAEFTGDMDNDEKIMEKYSKLSDEFESLGGYSYIHVQSEFIDTFELNDKLDKKFRELSGGERQYIRLAITLFSNSDLIILDEPLSFFDKKKTPGEYETTITFGEYASPSFDTVVETVGKAKTYGVMSIEQCIEEMYGDTWTDEEKEEEIKRIKEQNGYLVAEEPKTVDDSDISYTDDNGVETDGQEG